MYSGDIYTQTSQSLGYKTGDFQAMGWSSKPRFASSVRVGNWFEENIPIPQAASPEMITTAQESFRSPSTGQSRPDATARTAALVQQTQGKGSGVLLGANSLPSLTSLYASSFGGVGAAQTERSYDRNSGKWLPEPIDVLASSMQRGYAGTSSVKWFRGDGPVPAMQSTTKASPSAPALSPEDKRFARSYSFSRHLLTSRTMGRS